MNRIFRVIWNEVLKQFVVTSELGQSKRGFGKSTVVVKEDKDISPVALTAKRSLLTLSIIGLGSISLAQDIDLSYQGSAEVDSNIAHAIANKSLLNSSDSILINESESNNYDISQSLLFSSSMLRNSRATNDWVRLRDGAVYIATYDRNNPKHLPGPDMYMPSPTTTVTIIYETQDQLKTQFWVNYGHYGNNIPDSPNTGVSNAGYLTLEGRFQGANREMLGLASFTEEGRADHNWEGIGTTRGLTLKNVYIGTNQIAAPKNEVGLTQITLSHVPDIPDSGAVLESNDIWYIPPWTISKLIVTSGTDATLIHTVKRGPTFDATENPTLAIVVRPVDYNDHSNGLVLDGDLYIEYKGDDGNNSPVSRDPLIDAFEPTHGRNSVASDPVQVLALRSPVTEEQRQHIYLKNNGGSSSGSQVIRQGGVEVATAYYEGGSTSTLIYENGPVSSYLQKNKMIHGVWVIPGATSGVLQSIDILGGKTLDLNSSAGNSDNLMVPITGDGSLKLISDRKTLNIIHANSYTGNTELIGQFYVDTEDAFGNGGNLTITGNDSKVVLNEEITVDNLFNGGTLELGNDSFFITKADDARLGKFKSDSEHGWLVIRGDGILYADADNKGQRKTISIENTVHLNHISGLGDDGIDLHPSGTLQVNATGELINPLKYSGNLIINAKEVSLSNNNIDGYTGSIVITKDGRLLLSTTTDSLGTGSSLTNNGELFFKNVGGTFNHNLSGNGLVKLSQSGSIKFLGDNSDFTGTYEIYNAAFTFDQQERLGNPSLIILDAWGGLKFDSNNNSDAIVSAEIRGVRGNGNVTVADRSHLKLTGKVDNTLTLKTSNSGILDLSLSAQDDKTSFDYKLQGNGTFNLIGIGAGSKLAITEQAMSDFGGTFTLQNATVDLDSQYQTRFASNDVELKNGAQFNIKSDITIDNLELQGGTLALSTTKKSGRTENHLTVNDTLDLSNGIVRLDMGGGSSSSNDNIRESDLFGLGIGGTQDVAFATADRVVTGNAEIYLNGQRTTLNSPAGSTQVLLRDPGTPNILATLDYNTSVGTVSNGQQGLFAKSGLSKINVHRGYTVNITPQSGERGDFSVLVVGDGSLNLNGTMGFGNSSNSYAGDTTVRNGTVTLKTSNAFGKAGKLSVENSGYVNLNGQRLNVTTLELNGANSLSGHTDLLTIEGGQSTIGSSNNITGSILLRNGANVTLTTVGALGSSSSYNIEQGTLTFTNHGTINNNLRADSRNGVVAIGANSGSKTTLAGDNSSFNGTFKVLNGGHLSVSDINKLGTGSALVEIASNGQLSLVGIGGSSYNPGTINQQLSGSGQVNIDGSHIKFTNYSNNFSGNYQVNNGGSLVAIKPNQIGQFSTINLNDNNSRFVISGAFDDLKNSVQGRGILEVNSAGAVILSDANKLSQDVTVLVNGDGRFGIDNNRNGFNNRLQGDGTVAINGNGNAFAFGNNVGTDFRGTFELTRADLKIDRNNNHIFTNTHVKINNGSDINIIDNVTTEDLTLNNGTLEFTGHQGAEKADGVLSTGVLDLQAGTVWVHIDSMSSGSNPNATVSNTDLFKLGTGSNNELMLAKADRVNASNDVNIILNGQSQKLNESKDSISLLRNAQGAVVAKLSVGNVVTTENSQRQSGLYVKSGLTQIDIQENQDLAMDVKNSSGDINDVFGTKIIGAGNLTLDVGNRGVMKMGNRDNSYRGNTRIQSGVVQITTDNAFGSQGDLIIASNAGVNLDNKTQQITALDNQGTINFADRGTLVINDGATNLGTFTTTGDGTSTIRFAGGSATADRQVVTGNQRFIIEVAEGANLTLQQKDAFGASSFDVNGNLTLDANRDKWTFSNTLKGQETGNVNVANGEITLNNNSKDYKGGFTVLNTGHLVVKKQLNLGGSKGVFLNGSDSQMTINSVGQTSGHYGSLDHKITGTGTLNIGGINATEVDYSTVEVANNDVLGDQITVNVNKNNHLALNNTALNSKLTGNGQIFINANNQEYTFGSNVGNAFAGDVHIDNTKVTFGETNKDIFSNATVSANNGTDLTFTEDTTMKDMVLNGGTLNFNGAQNIGTHENEDGSTSVKQKADGIIVADNIRFDSGTINVTNSTNEAGSNKPAGTIDDLFVADTYYQIAQANDSVSIKQDAITINVNGKDIKDDPEVTQSLYIEGAGNVTITSGYFIGAGGPLVNHNNDKGVYLKHGTTKVKFEDGFTNNNPDLNTGGTDLGSGNGNDFTNNGGINTGGGNVTTDCDEKGTKCGDLNNNGNIDTGGGDVDIKGKVDNDGEINTGGGNVNGDGGINNKKPDSKIDTSNPDGKGGDVTSKGKIDNEGEIKTGGGDVVTEDGGLNNNGDIDTSAKDKNGDPIVDGEGKPLPGGDVKVGGGEDLVNNGNITTGGGDVNTDCNEDETKCGSIINNENGNIDTARPNGKGGDVGSANDLKNKGEINTGGGDVTTGNGENGTGKGGDLENTGKINTGDPNGVPGGKVDVGGVIKNGDELGENPGEINTGGGDVIANGQKPDGSYVGPGEGAINNNPNSKINTGGKKDAEGKPEVGGDVIAKNGDINNKGDITTEGGDVVTENGGLNNEGDIDTSAKDKNGDPIVDGEGNPLPGGDVKVGGGNDLVNDGNITTGGGNVNTDCNEDETKCGDIVNNENGNINTSRPNGKGGDVGSANDLKNKGEINTGGGDVTTGNGENGTGKGGDLENTGKINTGGPNGVPGGKVDVGGVINNGDESGGNPGEINTGGGDVIANGQKPDGSYVGPGEGAINNNPNSKINTGGKKDAEGKPEVGGDVIAKNGDINNKGDITTEGGDVVTENGGLNNEGDIDTSAKDKNGDPIVDGEGNPLPGGDVKVGGGNDLVNDGNITTGGGNVNTDCNEDETKCGDIVNNENGNINTSRPNGKGGDVGSANDLKNKGEINTGGGDVTTGNGENGTGKGGDLENTGKINTGGPNGVPGGKVDVGGIINNGDESGENPGEINTGGGDVIANGQKPDGSYVGPGDGAINNNPNSKINTGGKKDAEGKPEVGGDVIAKNGDINNKGDITTEGGNVVTENGGNLKNTGKIDTSGTDQDGNTLIDKDGQPIPGGNIETDGILVNGDPNGEPVGHINTGGGDVTVSGKDAEGKPLPEGTDTIINNPGSTINTGGKKDADGNTLPGGNITAKNGNLENQGDIITEGGNVNVDNGNLNNKQGGKIDVDGGVVNIGKNPENPSTNPGNNDLNNWGDIELGGGNLNVGGNLNNHNDEDGKGLITIGTKGDKPGKVEVDGILNNDGVIDLGGGNLIMNQGGNSTGDGGLKGDSGSIIINGDHEFTVSGKNNDLKDGVDVIVKDNGGKIILEENGDLGHANIDLGNTGDQANDRELILKGDKVDCTKSQGTLGCDAEEGDDNSVKNNLKGNGTVKIEASNQGDADNPKGNVELSGDNSQFEGSLVIGGLGNLVIREDMNHLGGNKTVVDLNQNSNLTIIDVPTGEGVSQDLNQTLKGSGTVNLDNSKVTVSSTNNDFAGQYNLGNSSELSISKNENLGKGNTVTTDKNSGLVLDGFENEELKHTINGDGSLILANGTDIDFNNVKNNIGEDINLNLRDDNTKLNVVDNNFNHGLKGDGTFNIQGSGEDFNFNFGDRVGDQFTGTVDLNNGHLTLNDNNEKTLTNGSLNLNQGGVLDFSQDNQGKEGSNHIGELDFAGGTLHFNTGVYDDHGQLKPTNQLHVNTLDVTQEGTVKVDRVPGDDLKPSVEQGIGLIELNNGTPLLQLVNAEEVKGDGSKLTLEMTDSNGNQISELGHKENISNKGVLAEGETAEIVAEGYFDLGLTTVGREGHADGLYVSYKLQNLAILAGKTVILEGQQGQENLFTANISDEVAGQAGHLEIRNNHRDASVTLEGNNSYTGTTTVTSGGLTAGADNALGLTSHLTIKDGANFNLNGKTQAVGGVTVDKGATFAGEGTLTRLPSNSRDSGAIFKNEGTLQVGMRGADKAQHLSINGSVANSGDIWIATDADGNVIGSTLTIDGDFTGLSGSNLYMNSYIDTLSNGNQSYSDKLIITGHASGETVVHVKTAGMGGKLNKNDLVIIETGSSTNSAFKAENAIFLGSYQYFLAKDQETENWYLTGDLKDQAVDPNKPSNGSGEGSNGSGTGSNGSGTGSNGSGTGSNGSGTGSNGSDTGSNGSGTGSNGSGTGSNGSGTGSNGSGTGSNGSGTGSNGSGTGSNGSGTGSNGSGTGSNGSGTGSNGSGTGSNGSGTGSNGSGTGSNGSGTGSNGSGTGSNGSGTGSNGSGTGSNGSGTGSNGSGTGSNGSGTGSNGSGTGSNGSGTGSNGSGTGSNGSGTGSNGSGTGSNGSGTGSNGSGTGSNGSGTGSNGSGAGSNGSGTGSNGSGTGSNGSGTGSNGSGTGSNGSGTGSNGSGTGSNGSGTGSNGSGTGSNGSGTGSNGSGTGSNGSGTGSNGSGTGSNGSGTGSNGSGTGSNGSGTGSNGSGTGSNGSGTGSNGSGTGSNGSGTGSNGSGTGSNGSGTGSNGSGTGSNGSGTGSNGSGTGSNGSGTGSNGSGTGSNGSGTGSNGSGTGSNGSGTGSNGSGTGSNGSGTGSNGSGTGSNGSGTGSNGSGTGSNGSGTGSNGSGTGSNGSGTGSNGSGTGSNGSGTGSNGSGTGSNGSGTGSNGSGEGSNGSGEGSNGSGEGSNGSGEGSNGSGEGSNGSGEGSNGSGEGSNGSGEDSEGSDSEGSDSEGSDSDGSDSDGEAEDKPTYYRPDIGVNIANTEAAVHTQIPGLGGVGIGGNATPSGIRSLGLNRTRGGEFLPESTIWNVTLGGKNRGRAGDDQLHYDNDYFSSTFGADRLFDLGYNGTAQLGLMFTTMRAKTSSENVANTITHESAKGRVTGQVYGIYGTWYLINDDPLTPYVDGMISYGNYRNTVQSRGNPESSYRSNIWSFTVQGGYPIDMGYNVMLEPQAQLTYLHFKAKDYVDENSGVKVKNSLSGNAVGRVGLFIYPKEGDVKPYAGVNLWYDGTKATTQFNNDKFSGFRGGLSIEAKAGVVGMVTDDLSLSLDAFYRQGRHKNKDYGATMTIKYRVPEKPID